VDGIVGPNTKAALVGSSSSVPPPIALTSSSYPADIQEGLISGCVTELHELLNQHGAALSVDGDFGANTLAAVKDFQSVHGLEVDGVVGPNTKAALDAGSGTVPAAISITSSSCPANMVQGEDDGCVTDLQELLNQNGTNLSVDGDFGYRPLRDVWPEQQSEVRPASGLGPGRRAADARPRSAPQPRCHER
jgi:peptidoglycan hydrolase-like protein with peptidoglycan-binding domain